MNTRFFDLSKEKQDRIINGSLKIFCRYGYRHASTDEIVAEAGISKGLLFHYFISKKGLVRFLYDYSSHYVLADLRRAGFDGPADYLDVQELLVKTEEKIMRIYPCMLLFLYMADCSEDPEVRDALADLPLSGAVSEKYRAILSAAAAPRSGRIQLTDADVARLTSLLTYLRLGITRDLLRKDEPLSEDYLDECASVLHLLTRMLEG